MVLGDQWQCTELQQVCWGGGGQRERERRDHALLIV